MEPSEAMRWLGIQIEQRARTSEADDPASNSSFKPHLQDSGPEGTLSKKSSMFAQGVSVASGDADSSTNHASIGDNEAESSEREQGGAQSVEEAQPHDEPLGRRIIIGDRLASPESSFGRLWSIRWLQHLQGFGDRKQMAATKSGARHRKRSAWVQSTGMSFSLLRNDAMKNPRS